MSHFEFISVAVSLIYALILAKLLGAVPVTLKPDRRYWIHTVWLVNLLLAAVGSGWRLWLLRDVEWTPTAFYAVLSFPAVFYLRAAVLLGDDPRAVTAWRDHFYATRRAFFLLQVVGSINLVVSNWIITGISPDRQLILVGVVGSVSAVVAVLSASPRIHGIIAVMLLLIFAYAPYAPR